jgi:CTP synthase
VTKYIFIVGGVISGLGKGITAASIGRLMVERGLKVTSLKMDAYVNLDAGTMNPSEHGEVYVTGDGVETDQDIGNYERFIGRSFSRRNYATTGQIYQAVIERERNLDYGGRCVEVVPHIPEEIIRRIENAAREDEADIAIVEIGGTVGEYQNILFIEAARMMKYRYQQDVLMVLVSYIPAPGSLGEMKTKPTQYASRTLNETGIQADFIICRAEKPLDEPRKRKIAILCNMQWDDIISAPDVDNIYRVPLILREQKLDKLILDKFGVHIGENGHSEWAQLMERIDRIDQTVKIGIVGKYFTTGTCVLADVYVSVIESIKHGCWANGVKPELTWLDSEEYQQHPEKLKELEQFNGVVIPGGFGSRGVEGIISAIRYVRENRIPFLGLCYGLQLAVVEYARNLCGLENAHTTEINRDTPHPVINLMPEQVKKLLGEGYGGTMRLGDYPCTIKPGTLAQSIYNTAVVVERHRHRYEVNNDYRSIMEERGLVFSGIYTDGNLAEIIELPRNIHPFYFSVQFHPEFKSRPLDTHPVFKNFAAACKKHALPVIRVDKAVLPETVKPISIKLASNLADFTRNGERQNLKEKLVSMSQVITKDVGVILPELHVEFSPETEQNSYSIKIRDNVIASGKIYRDRFLVIAPESKLRNLKGEMIYEPAFGYPGKWINRSSLKKVEQPDMVVMTPEEVLVSHCAYIIKTHIDELVGRQEVRNLVDNLEKTHPALVEEAMSGNINLGRITKIIKNLLREQVPVRDFVTIMETLADNRDSTSDSEILGERVRTALARSIAGLHADDNNNIDVIILDTVAEQHLANVLCRSEEGSYLALDNEAGVEILGNLEGEINRVREMGKEPVCLVAPVIRFAFRKLVERPFPDLAVLSWNEIPPEITINPVGTLAVGNNQVFSR